MHLPYVVLSVLITLFLVNRSVGRLVKVRKSIVPSNQVARQEPTTDAPPSPEPQSPTTTPEASVTLLVEETARIKVPKKLINVLKGIDED